MRSAIVRRVLFALLSVLVLGGGLISFSHLLHLVVAHGELARLNEERGASASFEDDPLTAANRAKTAKLLECVRRANLAAFAKK